MKLYIFILSSVITTLLLCWSLEPLRNASSPGVAAAKQQPIQETSLLAAVRVGIGIGPGGLQFFNSGSGASGWGRGFYNYGFYPYGRIGGYNPYQYPSIKFPQVSKTPGYSYWRQPKKGLLMLSPNRQQHYYPVETPDHPPVPWETR